LVEVVWVADDKKISTGAKRNYLLKQAQGEYVVFIDDDDWVPEYYVKEILLAARSGADCLAINGTMTTDGEQEVKWRISKDYNNEEVKEGGEIVLLRKTNHITAVKRELALAAGFPDKSNAEDKHYSDRLKLKTEFTVSKPMYHYRFSTKNKQYK
jgi:glycosyltransferase involved in cell wall biosynthesis